MPITVPQNLVRRNSSGSEFRLNGVFQYGLYQAGGSLIMAREVGLVEIKAFEVDQAGGFTFDPVVLTNGTGVLVKGYTSSGGVATGTNSLESGGTPSGIVSAPIFTGNMLPGHAHLQGILFDFPFPVVADVAVIVPGFSIMQNVFVTAGAVTGPFVMIPFTGPPPVSGQVAVNNGVDTLHFFPGDIVTAITVTCLLSTDASVTAGTPTGTNSAPTFTGDPLATHTHTFTGNPFGGGAAEIPNGTNLSSLGNIAFEATGL